MEYFIMFIIVAIILFIVFQYADPDVAGNMGVATIVSFVITLAAVFIIQLTPATSKTVIRTEKAEITAIKNGYAYIQKSDGTNDKIHTDNIDINIKDVTKIKIIQYQIKHLWYFDQLYGTYKIVPNE